MTKVEMLWLVGCEAAISMRLIVSVMGNGCVLGTLLYRLELLFHLASCLALGLDWIVPGLQFVQSYVKRCQLQVRQIGLEARDRR